MAESTATNQQKGTGEAYNGISIGSFLQMLEQEKSSCTVRVQSGDNLGFLFFSDGDLIDAIDDNTTGIEAAYSIVAWEKTSISLDTAVERKKAIDYPLGYILLNGAKIQDEQQDEKREEKTEKKEAPPQPVITYISQDVKDDPDTQKTVKFLSSIPAIRDFYLLNKAGKVVVHSAANTAMGELIVYFIITSSNLRKSLKTKSPRRIVLQMKDGRSLLILPLAGKIIAITLASDYSADIIANQVRSELLAK